MPRKDRVAGLQSIKLKDSGDYPDAEKAYVVSQYSTQKEASGSQVYSKVYSVKQKQIF